MHIKVEASPMQLKNNNKNKAVLKHGGNGFPSK